MWKKLKNQPVGGLREIGFVKNTDKILVLGSGGRTIFDCTTGEKIARDRFDYYHYKWNSETGILEGLGFCEGTQTICAGFEYHDQVLKETNDNWKIEIRNENRLDYKKESRKAEVMYLINSKSKIEVEVEVYHYGITRSYGFSPTGKSFITAQSYGIEFWTRDE